jgi:flagellar hook-associated protein 1 FlgK
MPSSADSSDSRPPTWGTRAVAPASAPNAERSPGQHAGRPTILVAEDGELRGLLDQRDGDLVTRIADVNTLLGRVITDVNAVHTVGFGLDSVTGRAFFSGTNASDIAVSAVVAANTNAIAASTTLAGVPGNAANATLISDLQHTKPLLAGTATYDEYYQSFISNLGSTTRQYEDLERAQLVVSEHLSQMREGASGVNLDEEMVQLMGYQRAYEAASRLVSVVDQMLDTLINRMAA